MRPFHSAREIAPDFERSATNFAVALGFFVVVMSVYECTGTRTKMTG
jgi:hypothetical protein